MEAENPAPSCGGANHIRGWATSSLLWADPLPSEIISAANRQTWLSSPLPSRGSVTSSHDSLESVITVYYHIGTGSQVLSLQLCLQPAEA